MTELFPSDPDLKLKDFLADYTERLFSSLNSLDFTNLDAVYDLLANAIERNSTIYTCGNGGSSSIAEHFVCDFIKGSSTDSTVDPKVFPLLNTPTITAIGNDIGYEDIFSYQIEKFGSKDDVLMAVSSSGNSENIIRAIKMAKLKKMVSISFVGFDGGEAKDLSDISIHVDSENYGIVEDAHHCLMHIFAQYLRLKKINDSSKLGNIKF